MTLLSMNEITTFRWSFEEDVENYQRAGYKSIGVWRQKLTEGDEDAAIDLLIDSGLHVSNLLWAGGFTGSDGRTLAESIDDAQEAIRLAAAIGAECLVIYPGGRNNHTYRHAGRLLRTALDELLPFAEAADVTLAIQPMHAACAAEWTFLTDLRTVMSLIDEFQSRQLKLAYDTYHFPTGPRQSLFLAQLVSYLGIVHLGDRHAPPGRDQEYCPLGQGCLPLMEIVVRLQEAGYTGTFDVKLVGADIAVNDYWSLLDQSKMAFAEMAHIPVPPSLA